MKAWDGAWTERPAKFWNGSAWVACTPKTWNGLAWVGGGGGAPAIVAPAYRAFWNTNYGSNRPQTDIDKPAGTVENDIMIASMFIGRGSVITNDATPPDGTWTQIGTKTNVQQGTTFYGQFAAWWKRAGASEPAFYSFTTAGVNYNTQGVIQSISGCPTSGSPVDAVGQNQLNTQAGSNIFPIASITTTQANALLLWLIHNWDAGGALSPPTGMTERLDHLTYCADKIQAAAGPTGEVNQLQASGLPAAGYLIALKGT